jgi:hypothetical protein
MRRPVEQGKQPQDALCVATVCSRHARRIEIGLEQRFQRRLGLRTQ